MGLKSNGIIRGTDNVYIFTFKTYVPFSAIILFFFAYP